MAHLLVVDGNNLHTRAQFAARGRVELSASGINTASLLISLNMMAKYVSLIEPTDVLVCFDAGYAWRTRLVPEYKANRKERPHDPALGDMETERDVFRMVLGDLGVATLSVSGYEADDLIAAAVQKWTGNPDAQVSILSGDRDLLQLLSARVDQYLLPDIFPTTPDVFERKHGYPPHRSPMVKALQGDSSDNLTGVPGIGPKKALSRLEKAEWNWLMVLAGLDADEADLAQRTLEIVDLVYRPYLDEDAGLAWTFREITKWTHLDPLSVPERAVEVLEALMMQSVLGRLREGRFWRSSDGPGGDSSNLFRGF